MKRLRIIGSVVGAAALTMSAALADEPVNIPGGQLDTSIRGIDLYVGTPKMAEPGDNPACRAAKGYFDMEGQGKYGELSTLFTENPVFLDPLRESLTGRLDVSDFYKNHISKLNPTIIPVAYVGQGMDCYVETSVRWTFNGEARWMFSALDQFTVNSAGKIERFIVFLRPAPSAEAPKGALGK